MSCTSSSVCGCARSACPLPAGVGNALGFANAAPCCSAPCPSFPLHKVTICLKLNDRTCAKIQQGCLESPVSESTCTVKYGWGQIMSSDGKSCRVVKFDRWVPRNSFVRIRLCACDACDSVLCSETDSTNTNQLLSFLVDGADFTSLLALARAQESGSIGCVYVGCQGRTVIPSSCCDSEWTLDDMPFGSEIEFGPIGQTLSPP